MPDRRLVGRVFLVVTLLGTAGALLTARLSRDGLAFTLGVPSGGVAAVVQPHREVCQGPVVVPPDAAFDRVGLRLGTYFRPGPRVGVTVRDAGSGRVEARGTLPGGYPDIARAGRQLVSVAPAVPAGRRVDVCIDNRGDRRVAVFGSGAAAARTSSARLDGRPIDQDLDLVFETSEPRSLLALAPVIPSRASLFRPGWVGPWTYALLGLVVLVGVPWLTLSALRSAARE